MLRLTTFLLLTLLTACAADSAPIDKDDPFGFRGPVAGGPAAERPAIAPKDVGVSAEALTVYTNINSNNGFPLNSEASHKKAALRGYVMQWGDPGFNCTFGCPDGTVCSSVQGGSCGIGSILVQLYGCHQDSGPFAPYQICNVKQNGQFWGIMRYCQGTSSLCTRANFWWVDSNNSAHQFGEVFLPTNKFTTLN